MTDKDITDIVQYIKGEYEKAEGGADKKDKNPPENSHEIITRNPRSTKSPVGPPKITDIKTVWHGIDKKIIDLPLRPATLTFNLQNTNVAVANAFRRVLMDELLSPRLSIKPGSFYSTDPFMTEHFVRNNIELIPLLRILNPDVQKMKFKLHVQAKNSVDLKELKKKETQMVYSSDIVPLHGKLPFPIMNSTFELAELQEGAEIKIDEISIEYGTGSKHAAFATSSNGSIRNLDIEQYTDKDINSKNGKAAYESGYKTSSLLAESREFEVTVTLRSMNESSCQLHAKELLRDTCQVMLSYNNTVRKEPRQFSISQIDNKTKHITKIVSLGMTDTIAHVITRAIDESIPEIDHVSYRCIPHKANIEITIIHELLEEEINQKIDTTFDYIDEMFKSLKTQI